MAVAQLATPTTWNFLHEAPIVFQCTKVTQSDWIHVAGYKGVIPLSAMNKATTSGANTYEAAWTWGTATNTGTLTATATSMPVTSVTIGRGATSSPFYCLTPVGEIIEVTNDSTPTLPTSTFTIKRGCLGTTAGVITAADTVAVMNILFLGSAGVGKTLVVALPLPNEEKANMFVA